MIPELSSTVRPAACTRRRTGGVRRRRPLARRGERRCGCDRGRVPLRRHQRREDDRARGARQTRRPGIPLHDAAGRMGHPRGRLRGTTGGLSANRSTLVLAQLNPYTCVPRRCTWSTTRFAIFTPAGLRRRATVSLHGRYAYDAISPDGRLLYLIQYVSETDQTRYLVRAYDLRARPAASRLDCGPHAARLGDAGPPMARTASAGGRFVYTLTEHRRLPVRPRARHCARCGAFRGLPWTGAQTSIGAMWLTLRDGGRTLALAVPAGLRRPARTRS